MARPDPRPKTPPELASDEAREALDRILMEALPTLSGGLAGLFALATVLGLVAYPPKTHGVLFPLGIVTTMLYVGLFVALRGWTPPIAWADGIAFGMALVALVNAFLPPYLVGDPVLGVWLILVVIGTGLILTTGRVVTAIYALTGVAWAFLGTAVPDVAAWGTMSFALLISAVLGVVGHVVRVRELTRLEALRAAEEGQRTELEREVEQRRRIEQQLRVSRERLRTVITGAPIALFSLDGDGAFTLVEGQAVDEADLAAEDLLGRDAREVFAEHPQIPGNVDRVLAGEEFVDEIEYDDRIFETRYTPMTDEEGRVQGAVGVAIDVTARKQAEEERRRREQREMEIRRLEEISRFKTDLLNRASHELNTPLTPMKMQVHRMKRSDMDPEERRRAAEILERNLDRLSRVASDILDVSRVEAGQLKFRPEAVDLADLVPEIVESFEAMAEEEDVRLVLEADEEVVVRADADRIAQVQTNLLSNALKFTPEGGRVTVSIQAVGDGGRVRVRDSGIGLDEEQIDDLFQPFSRVHDPMEQTRTGTGLGLYLCRKLVEAHGGEIRAESPGPGKGSTFEFWLPRSPPEEA